MVDPLGGSYYVEALTNDLAEKAWALIEEVEALGGMTKAVESGMPKLRIEESAARRQARVDRGEDVVVGVNKYVVENPELVDVLDIDNADGAAPSRSPSSSSVRADARRRGRARPPSPPSPRAPAGDGNLLALCIDAARARATVGEMSDAMEQVFGRHRAEIRTDHRRVRARATRDDEAFAGAARPRSPHFADERGPPPPDARGEDGPGRPRPRRQGHRHRRSPTSASTSTSAPSSRRRPRPPRDAVENDVHVVGVSSQAAGHKTLVPQLIDELKAKGAGDVLVVVGGVIPPQDYDVPPRRRRGRHLRPRHQHPRRRHRGPRPHRPRGLTGRPPLAGGAGTGDERRVRRCRR